MHIRMKNEEKQKLKGLAKLNHFESIFAYVKDILFGKKMKRNPIRLRFAC